MVTSSLCVFWNHSTTSLSVGLPGMSKRSHSVQSTSPYWRAKGGSVFSWIDEKEER